MQQKLKAALEKLVALDSDLTKGFPFWKKEWGKAINEAKILLKNACKTESASDKCTTRKQSSDSNGDQQKSPDASPTKQMDGLLF